MIKYWPEKQGIDLNIEVVNLFKKIYYKFDNNLHNNTSYLLSIDIINFSVKRKLFKVILYELEILVLDIIELNLTVDELKILTKKITLDLIKKSIDNFNLIIQTSIVHKFNHLEKLSNYDLLLDNLLIYLIFGSKPFVCSNSLFFNIKVPLKYVEILLDNLIIQMANIVCLHYFFYKSSLSSLLFFLMSKKICNDTYISIKSLAMFKNNLIWQDLLDYYIIQPKSIYSNRYQVWLLTANGLNCKYIYISRESDFFKLDNLQLIIIIFFELQDFLLPKINKICFDLSKIFIYFAGYFFNQCFKFLLKNIFFIFRAKNINNLK